MGFFWDLYQQSQLSDQHDRASSLEDRVRQLEDRLGETTRIVGLLLERLEQQLGEDIDGDGRVGQAMNVSVVDGDLLDQDVDVIVNAWNRNIIPWWLLLPQGVSRAIKKRGGYAPFRELGRSRSMTNPINSSLRFSASSALHARHILGIDEAMRVQA